MIHAKFIQADGTVSRRTGPNEEFFDWVLTQVGGTYVLIDRIHEVNVVIRDDEGLAVAIEERYEDEINDTLEIAPPGATLESLNGIDFSAVRAAAIKSIDDAAGTARLRYITDVPGQQYVYQLKYEEASKAIEDESLDPSHYPMLSAEGDVLSVAVQVITAKDTTDRALAEIESVRMAAKKIIPSLPDDEEAINSYVLMQQQQLSAI